MADETYGEERARNLEALLRNLAARIVEMDARGELLKQAGELMRLIGDVRSELFHYEVRATYDRLKAANVALKTEVSRGGPNVYFMCVGPDGITVEGRAPAD